MDLKLQSLQDESGKLFNFEIDEFRKYCLLNGLDEIDLTLQHADKIKSYEARLKKISPWLIT